MTLKRLIPAAISFCMAMSVYASDTERISLGAYVTASTTIPAEAASMLTAKMQKAITANGLGDDRATGRFALVANCDILEKDVAPTTPPRISQKIEITFAVVDMIDNKVYGSCDMTVSGIGTNETKAFNTAFQKVSGQNQQIKTLLSEVKEKILDYYTNSCPQLMTKANTLAANGEYDQAIFLLMSVPEVSQVCYTDCHQLASSIFQQKIDNECAIKLSRAQNKWAVSQTGETALEVADLISEIDPRYSDYSEVMELRHNITKKLEADEQYRRELQMKREAEIAAEKKRQWDFKMKKYEDDVKFKNSVLDACRSVGEIFANKFEMPQINILKKH